MVVPRAVTELMGPAFHYPYGHQPKGSELNELRLTIAVFVSEPELPFSDTRLWHVSNIAQHWPRFRSRRQWILLPLSDQEQDSQGRIRDDCQNEAPHKIRSQKHGCTSGREVFGRRA